MHIYKLSGYILFITNKFHEKNKTKNQKSMVCESKALCSTPLCYSALLLSKNCVKTVYALLFKI